LGKLPRGASGGGADMIMRIRFSVDQPKDHIQGHHLLGRFYEADELLIMSRAFPVGGRFLDIGANTGNHSIFFGKIMKASYILPIEVNPRIMHILRSNIALNGLSEVCDLRHLGKGLHSEMTDSASIRFAEKNIGGATVSRGGGALTLVRADDILTEPFDLVKIDVEGAEIEVLNGMERFVAEFRPSIFVEVNDENAEAFTDWIDIHGYAICDEFKRHKRNKNVLIAPDAS
jgi:FkbM family methyltransferase